VGSVADVISAQAARYDVGLSAIHAAIHGTADPAAIERQLERFVIAAMGSSVRQAIFHVASVGSVTGVVLSDDRRIVIKAYQPRWGRRFLDSVIAIQGALAAAGFACARPLSGPLPFGHGWATVESVLDDPGQPTMFGPDEMRASARGLAELTAAAPSMPGLHDNPLHQPFDGLYPSPHSPLFDFDATVDGTEWIDDLAAVARPYLDRGRRVVAHTDWSARNVRLSATGVRAFYDLDSLAVVPLPAALGQAAVTWRSTAEPGDAAAPGVEEVEAWLGSYPDPLTDAEKHETFAHVLYHLAYTSRCEHAIDPGEQMHRCARPTLRDQADELVKRIPDR
jgi:Ser/Thr protein kinase RdoA (MazF antagonist)